MHADKKRQKLYRAYVVLVILATMFIVAAAVMTAILTFSHCRGSEYDHEYLQCERANLELMIVAGGVGGLGLLCVILANHFANKLYEIAMESGAILVDEGR